VEIGLAAWMFPVLLATIFVGVPIAFALMSVALVFGFMRFGWNAVYVFQDKMLETTEAHVLAALPLFVLMGAILERSGIAGKLFDAIHIWTWRLPGGLAVGTVVMCTIFAACSGVIGATETVVGLLAVPAMLRHGYDKGLISGTVTAGGSLGAIIPPSVVVIILAVIGELPLGDMFMGMLIPGLMMAGFYMAYIVVRCWINPSFGPSEPAEGADAPLADRLKLTATALFPPLSLVVGVLGSILFGIATPTDAAAVGAFGVSVLSIAYGSFTWPMLRQAVITAIVVTAMILTIVVGGKMFGGVFLASGGFTGVQNLLAAADLGAWGSLFLILGLVFLAGFVLDGLTIILIVVPIGIPIITGFGFDPVWFAVLFLIVKQTSYLTPPMAGAIFYFRAIAPPEITLMDMYRGVVPFIILDLIVLGLVLAFPQLALWLPSQMVGFE
jgi:tripartite ATP-independent transporter DctM subunit